MGEQSKPKPSSRRQPHNISLNERLAPQADHNTSRRETMIYLTKGPWHHNPSNGGYNTSQITERSVTCMWIKTCLKLWCCHFPIGILGQVWCLIVSIPDLFPFSYFVWPSSLRAKRSPKKVTTHIAGGLDPPHVEQLCTASHRGQVLQTRSATHLQGRCQQPCAEHILA